MAIEILYIIKIGTYESICGLFRSDGASFRNSGALHQPFFDITLISLHVYVDEDVGINEAVLGYGSLDGNFAIRVEMIREAVVGMA